MPARRRAKQIDPPTVSAAAFNRAVALAGLIRHGLQATVQGQRVQAALEQTRRLFQQLQCEHARLCAERHQRSPAVPAAGAQPAPGSRTQQLAQAVLDYIHQHYHRPMSLKDVTANLQMNPDYLAHVFAHTVGRKFRHYLQELRLAKAGELLQDPRQRVCDVACAVGFSSAAHFRHAFKARLGVAPSTWRSGPSDCPARVSPSEPV